MNIILTLDYELFLGKNTGSIDNCLIRPLDAYIESIEKYGAKFTIFVDATYLYRLKDYSTKYEKAAEDYKKISTHIKNLQQRGHEIQLHIHPHWFYSDYNGQEWNMDQTHYKLCDLPLEEAEKIFSSSKALLDSIIGSATTAFRAGGFSTQPTEILKQLFEQNEIKADTSVCPGNIYDSPQQKYDYLRVPVVDKYMFSNDICLEDPQGKYIEIPITTYKISPLFYWKLACNRLLKLNRHRIWGDGEAVVTTAESIKVRLTRYTQAMACIDGYKISYLKDIYKFQKKRNREILCVLGHPKLATNYSVIKLEEFCKYATSDGAKFLTISQCYE
ncbi:MAG: hypothetical protein J6C80_05465 [Flavobacteriales bacterium]|nr:hypothetical protein [Flavobacteriales bacterium]